MPRSHREDTASHAAKDELIGLQTRIVASGHPPLRGVEGTVVDETAGTFVIEKHDGSEIVVPKPGQRFGFATERGWVEIDGDVLAKSPEERIKIKERR
ncbi:MAG: ribonuclease P protein component 1 [Thermoplasmatota archaeon]